MKFIFLAEIPKTSQYSRIIFYFCKMAVENGNDSRLMASLRHGERVDYLFGKNWCDVAFNSKGIH